MTRRFELGPIIVAVGSLLLLVSLFLDWYGPGITAWDAFELVDLLLAVLAFGAVVLAVATLATGGEGGPDRRFIPWIGAGVGIIVAASIINPPPAATGRPIETGAWIAFAAAMAILAGAVLSISRVSFSVALEGREPPERVAAVDQRQQTTETAAVMSTRRGRMTREDTTEATKPAETASRTDEG